MAAVLKCKMCGGTIDFNPGESVGICEFCGTKQTLPKTNDEVIANLFNRANNLRLKCEFDKAEQIYERIVQQDDSEAEAHWGIILCKYGIEYVEDPKTFERVPTCHRTRFESIRTDADYEAAIDYADTLQQSIYEKEAREIDKLQKDILAIVKNEEPFDVFICYKETDDSGKRTVDSTLANDIYHQLTQNGLKVFYAAITLEDKLGQEYEPYIFAALNSAKVMLVIGTKPEYFTAVWVKNEWSRFMNLMKTDRSKILIPCYRDMDAYDLPEEFAHLQAQDMSRIGFIQDIIRGVEKVVGKEAKAQTPAAEASVSAGPNVNTLLKRAFMSIEDGDWDKANDFCEQVLNLDPENAQAYLGKLMAECKVRKQEDLKKCRHSFDKNNNYAKIMRFGDKKTVSTLTEYNTYINHRNNSEQLKWSYNYALEAMNKADTVNQLYKAAQSFKSLANYENAESLASECLRKAKTIERQIDAIAVAVKDKKAGKKTVSLQEQLKKEKAELYELQILVQEFDNIVSEIRGDKKETEFYKEEIEQLQAKRASLGLFAGKEKKQIDSEIDALTVKTESIEETIKTKTEKLKGFSSRQEAEDSIQEKEETISDLQSKIHAMYEEGVLQFSYEQAHKLYFADVCVRNSFNHKYPNLIETLTTIKFGKYYQQSKRSMEPIEWIILDRKENNYLLMSKYALEKKSYNYSQNYTPTSATWDTCSLRKWLNDTFIKTAFSIDEQKMIRSTNVVADKNPEYKTSPGKNTNDKVFLLSLHEAKKYLRNGLYDARTCKGTAYCLAQSKFSNKDGTICWWLRTPGFSSKEVVFVGDKGNVDNDLKSGTNIFYGVRPVLWINLESIC